MRRRRLRESAVHGRECLCIPFAPVFPLHYLLATWADLDNRDFRPHHLTYIIITWRDSTDGLSRRSRQPFH